jgi:hypothetical protein
MLTFNEILRSSRLREKSIPVEEALEDNNIVSFLKRAPATDKHKEYLADNATNAYEVVMSSAKYGGGDSFIILSPESNKPLGFITFMFNILSEKQNQIFTDKFKIKSLPITIGDKYVDEIALGAFQGNGIVLVRDSKILFDEFLDKYKMIKWSVAKENPIKKAYDRFILQYPNSHTFEFPYLQGKFYIVLK